MLTFTPQPEARRVLVRAEGEVGGAEYVAGIMAFLERDPTVLAWDFVYDLRRYRGSVGHDDLAELARRLEAAFGTIVSGATTVLVSPDEGYRFWTRFMEVQFPHRRFAWAADLAEAEAILAAARRAGAPTPEGPARSC